MPSRTVSRKLADGGLPRLAAIDALPPPGEHGDVAADATTLKRPSATMKAAMARGNLGRIEDGQLAMALRFILQSLCDGGGGESVKGQRDDQRVLRPSGGKKAKCTWIAFLAQLI